jgi:hypothetical protein
VSSTIAQRTVRRAPDPATRKPRGKSRRVIVEAKGRDADVREWRKAFRAAPIPDGPKALGFTMSTYGNSRGGEIFPGNVRLAADHHCDERTIHNHIKVLVKTGWVRLTSNHRAGARRTDADEYQLTIPDPTLSVEAPREDQDTAGIDDWHLREPDEEPDDQWTDFSTGPDDHWKDLTAPVDKVVRPPRDVPSNKERLSRADRRSAPGPGGPRITADAATANGVTESPETPQPERVPKQRKASTVSDETRTERNRYIALIPRLSVDEVQEVLDDLTDVRWGVWKWAHNEMRKTYGEPPGRTVDGEDVDYYEPETPEKARLMYVKAFLCTSKSGVWHKCLTEPLDAVDDA